MGNCLEKVLSDESDLENINESTSSTNEDESGVGSGQDQQSNPQQLQQSDRSSRRRSQHRHRHRHRHGNISSFGRSFTSSNPYTQIIDSTGSSSGSRRFLSQSFNNGLIGSSSSASSSLSSVMSSSLPTGSQQVYYITPNVQRTADQLTEEEQIKLLKRMTLIQQLPSGAYDENKKNKECVICMIDFELKDTIKYLPCMHTFHQSCIDTWLLRSLICPSCMEPVDAGLLAAYES